MSQMQSIFSKLITLLTIIVPFRILPKITGQRLILPFYHIVTNHAPAHTKHLYPARSIKKFKNDIEFFLKHYKIIDYESLKNSILNHTPLKENCFLLSFDDGLRECHEIVAPILKEKGIPAIFFINPAFIDNKALFHRYKLSVIVSRLEKRFTSTCSVNSVENTLKINKLFYKNIPESILSLKYEHQLLIEKIADISRVDFNEYLRDIKPYMTTSQVKDLINQGFKIGSHSIDHPEYQNIDINVQVDQTIESLNRIKAEFQINDSAFAFPFSDFDIKSDFFDQIYKEVDLSFGTAGLKKDQQNRNLQRIPMEKVKANAKAIIKFQYIYYVLKSFVKKNTIIRK